MNKQAGPRPKTKTQAMGTYISTLVPHNIHTYHTVVSPLPPPAPLGEAARQHGGMTAHSRTSTSTFDGGKYSLTLQKRHRLTVFIPTKFKRLSCELHPCNGGGKWTAKLGLKLVITGDKRNTH